MHTFMPKADFIIIQSSFVAICEQMHVCFSIEEYQQAEYNEILIEANFLCDMQIALLNKILFRISRKNKFDFVIKYELDKDDECPYEYERPEHTLFWLKNKYNISVV